jgi:hypothetical protein
MADYSAFAPKALDLSGIAALMGPTPGQQGVISQSAPRRISMIPMMNTDNDARDRALQAAFGSQEADNALRSLMMEQAIASENRGQDTNLARVVAPALINKGLSSQAANLQPVNDMMIDPSAYLDQSMSHDHNQDLIDIADAFLKGEQGKAAGVNANANMIAANAAQTRAANGGGTKYTVNDMGLQSPFIKGQTNDPADLPGMIEMLKNLRGSQGVPTDQATTDYGNSGQGAGSFTELLSKNGQTIVETEKNVGGTGYDRVTTDKGVTYYVNPLGVGDVLDEGEFEGRYGE